MASRDSPLIDHGTWSQAQGWRTVRSLWSICRKVWWELKNNYRGLQEIFKYNIKVDDNNFLNLVKLLLGHLILHFMVIDGLFSSSLPLVCAQAALSELLSLVWWKCSPENHMKVTLPERELPPWCWWHFWVYGHTCCFYETLQEPDGVAGDSECQCRAGLPCKSLVDVHKDRHTNKTEDANSMPFQCLSIRKGVSQKARQMWRGAYWSRTVCL